MKSFTVLLFLVFLVSFTSNVYSQDARSEFPGKIFTESDFTPGDSCSVTNPERHDDFTHENGYRISSDSCRYLVKMRPAQLPWTYTKVCIGWTKTGALTSLNYDIIVYDTLGAGGAPGSILMIIPGQSIAGIPQFPLMIWNSSVVSIPVTGAVYIGARWTGNAQTGIFMSVDENGTLWPGYETGTNPPVWTTIQTVHSLYKCMSVRTEGQPGGGGNNIFFTQWCPEANFPVCPSISIFNACEVLGDTLYCAIGSTDNIAVSTLVYRYSIISKTWSAGVPVPVGKAQATLTKCNGKLYLVGGGSPNTNGTTDVYEYTPSTGAWVLKAPLPTAKSGHTTVNWGDSVLIVCCGAWTTPDANVYVYRPASNTWSTSTPFSGALRRSQAGGIVGNKIYIAGGFPFTNTLMIGTIGANANTITWAAGPPFPSVNKSRLGGVGVGNRFYIIGGNNAVGTTSSDSTFIFETTSNTWSALPSIKPSQVHNVSSSVVYWKVGDSVKIACVGGTSGTVVATNSLHVIGCGPIVTGTQNPGSQLPDNYSLSQNYPNPFNPSTKISFAIPKAGIVKLIVFDVLGREVVTLVNEFRTAGTHTVEFNASNLSSGVYLYRIEAGNFKVTKKMLLIK